MSNDVPESTGGRGKVLNGLSLSSRKRASATAISGLGKWTPAIRTDDMKDYAFACKAAIRWQTPTRSVV